MKKPQVSLDYDVYDLLKRYCAKKRGRKLSHVASQALKSFLQTEHREMESEGNMIIEGQREKPKTIVAVLNEDQEGEEARKLEEQAKRLLKQKPQIVRKGNRYIVKKERLNEQN